MMKKKNIREQVAFGRYDQVQPEATRHTKRREVSREESRGNIMEQRSLQRVVSVPETDPSKAWNTFAQRQEQRRSSHAAPQRYVKAIPRTLAQTGTHASSGRMKSVRRPLTHNASPVPTRSGRNRARRGFLWKLLGMLAIGAIVVLAASFALTGSAFRIAQVNVVGTHNSALIGTIQHMGMQGQNIFFMDVTSLTEHIDALPPVASTELSKQLPNGLTVSVVERKPVLLWQTAQGTYGVDSQGVVIAPASETTGADHLVTVQAALDGAQGGQGSPTKAQSGLRPGMRLNGENVSFALELVKNLPKLAGVTTFKLHYTGTIYGDTIDQLGGRPDSRGSYIVESSDGWRAYLGGAYDTNPLDNRLIELRNILALAQKQQLNVATIDLRYGLHPVFTVHQ